MEMPVRNQPKASDNGLQFYQNGRIFRAKVEDWEKNPYHYNIWEEVYFGKIKVMNGRIVEPIYRDTIAKDLIIYLNESDQDPNEDYGTNRPFFPFRKFKNYPKYEQSFIPFYNYEKFYLDKTWIFEGIVIEFENHEILKAFEKAIGKRTNPNQNSFFDCGKTTCDCFLEKNCKDGLLHCVYRIVFCLFYILESRNFLCISIRTVIKLVLRLFISLVVFAISSEAFNNLIAPILVSFIGNMNDGILKFLTMSVGCVSAWIAFYFPRETFTFWILIIMVGVFVDNSFGRCLLWFLCWRIIRSIDYH